MNATTKQLLAAMFWNDEMSERKGISDVDRARYERNAWSIWVEIQSRKLRAAA